MKEEAFRNSLRKWLRRDFDSNKEAANAINLHPQQISDALRGVIPVPNKLSAYYGYDSVKERIYFKAGSQDG
jgi:hypothetical protein